MLRRAAPAGAGDDVRAEAAARAAGRSRSGRRALRGRASACCSSERDAQRGRDSVTSPSRRRRGRQLGAGRPSAVDLHAVLGERAGLVGADDVGRPERLDRAQTLDERAPRASRRTPTASASVIVGSRPSGTLATSSPIAKHDRVARATARRPAPSGHERDAGDHRDQRDQPGDAADLDLQRAVARPRRAARARRCGRAAWPCRSRRRRRAPRRRCRSCR